MRPGRFVAADVYPYALILPSFLLAAFVIAYPLVDLAATSVREVTRFGQLRGFVAWRNFIDVLADPLFRDNLARTLEWTVGVVGGTIAVLLPVGLVLNLRFLGRTLARSLIMVPWAVSLTMTAIVWRGALNGQSGLLNLTLQELGLLNTPVAWLANGDTAFPMEIFIGVLISIPFTATVLLGGLASLPTDIYAAAAIEGAIPWQQFNTLTLPLLRPFLKIAIVLNVIYVFNSSPIVWVMTEGGPANATDILLTYLYKLTFVFGRMGDAAAVSLITFFLLLCVTLLYLRLVHRRSQDYHAERSLLALAPLVLLNLCPFAVMLATAAKPPDEVLSAAPSWLPRRFAWDNFVAMWHATNFGAALLNRLYVALLSGSVSIAPSIPAAYVLSRFRFRARRPHRDFLLITQTFSPMVLVLGLFRLTAALGLLNSVNALVLI